MRGGDHNSRDRPKVSHGVGDRRSGNVSRREIHLVSISCEHPRCFSRVAVGEETSIEADHHAFRIWFRSARYSVEPLLRSDGISDCLSYSAQVVIGKCVGDHSPPSVCSKVDGHESSWVRCKSRRDCIRRLLRGQTR